MTVLYAPQGARGLPRSGELQFYCNISARLSYKICRQDLPNYTFYNMLIIAY